MSIRILVDSSTDMTKDVMERVDILPLTITFGNDTYIDGVTIDNDTFYKRLVSESDLPKTSQATPAAFAEKFEQAKQAGDDIIAITISSGLSGTFQSAMIAAQDFDNAYVVDSKNVTIGAGILVKRALELVDEGLSAAEITEMLIQERKKVQLIAMVDTLEYLKRGGRISKTVAIAGGLLGIKPIICMKDGVLEVIGKARGIKQAFNQLKKDIEEFDGINYDRPYLFGYTGLDDSLMRRFITENEALCSGNTGVAPTSIVGSVVGTHAGPGAVAISFFSKKNGIT